MIKCLGFQYLHPLPCSKLLVRPRGGVVHIVKVALGLPLLITQGKPHPTLVSNGTSVLLLTLFDKDVLQKSLTTVPQA